MSDTRDKLSEQYQLQPEMAAGAPEAIAPEQAPQESSGSMVREIVETIVLALILFLVIRQVVQNYRIESHSMEPNFYEGEFVLVSKLAYRLGEPERGNVVVFQNPNNAAEDYIKRVIGLPGDTVEVVGDTILINGEELPQPYVHNANPEGTYFGPLVVPDGTIFVMGDNRPRSSDSRAIGPIDESLLRGQAWLRVWPLNKFGFVTHYDLAPGEIVRE
jgi:signal peptidase I